MQFSIRNRALQRPVVSAFLLSFLAGLPLPANAQNILNNGGFETGLMCYGYWTWSNTGIDFAGDYLFTLSSDSHSGNYSAQIACKPGGTDCPRAAIISDPIPTTPGQTYILSAWIKCPSGGRVDFNAEDSAGIFYAGPATCNGTWTQSSLTMTMSATATAFNFYLFNFGAQTALFDDVVLTYGDGTAPAPSTLHGGTRTTSVSGTNVIVDGSPYLALGFFNVPPSDISLVKATGANTAHGSGGSQSAACFNTGPKSYLDQLYEAGLNFVPDSTSTAHMDTPAVFPGIIQTFQPHLANIAWFLADEPDLVEVPVFAYVDPTTFVAEGNAARSANVLPMFADMQHAAWSEASDDAPYAPAVDFWMAEPYGEDFSTLQHATSLLTSIAPRPIWLAEDLIDPTLIVPKAHWAIVNGATGIFYFTWPLFKANPDALAAATQAFSELTTLQGAIFGTKIDSLVAAPSGVTTMSRYSQGTSYIMAVNPTATAVQGKFLVSGLTAGQQVNVLFENRTLTATAGAFTDSFSGIGRHVYTVSTPNTTLAGAITGKTGTAASRTWNILAYNTGLAMANGTDIANVTFTHTGGTACTPQVAPGTFPMTLGSLAPGASATGNVTVNFTGCDTTSKFTVTIWLSANSGATTASATFANQRY
jgi:hypothetical protein